MRLLRDPDEGHLQQDLVSFLLGGVGGLAAGILISRAIPQDRRFGDDLRTRARSVARRLRPARLQRLAIDQEELDRLEDRVLDAFHGHPVLSERGVDIGAISYGIIELSGMVWTEDEAEQAVALANGVPGVRTVVNRMEVDDAAHRASFRRPLDEDELESTFVHQGGRSGMGRRRQGASTDPDRRDDSQHQREDALAAADREQWRNEGYAHTASRLTERPEAQRGDRSRFSEDELDNQDPHGKNAERTLDTPPQQLNSSAQVGEGMKPGTELSLEHSEISIDEEPPRDRDG